LPEKKEQGDPEVIEFEELDLDNKNTPSQEEQLTTFLKEKLTEEDFSAAAKIMGIATDDLSNAELLEKLTELLQGKQAQKPGEEEYPSPDEDKKKKPEVEMADYKTFVKDCMAGGKTVQECAEEYKKKYPEPKEEPAQEELPELSALENRVAELEGQLHMEKVSNEVSQLVSAKHLAPIQRDAVIKLSARLSEEDRVAFLGVFKTQKFKVAEDAGQASQTRPGELGKMTPERKAEIIKLHGIDDLIQDRAVKKLN